MARLQRQRTVLITGASSGIGRAAASTLAARGYRVFAGVRRAQDASALQAAIPSGLEPLILDVTDAESIQAARETIEQATADTGLDALINNAGISLPGPLELIPLAALRRQFEVNVIGVLAMIQQFIPALRATRGRIVNIGSVAGLVAAPFHGTYSASKHALEGLNDSLRRELRPFHIEVSLIEPGSIDTKIWGKGLDEGQQLISSMSEHARTLYGTAADQARAAAHSMEARAASPDVVTACIVHALEAKRPKTRYLAGTDALVTKALAQTLPDRVLDYVLRKAL